MAKSKTIETQLPPLLVEPEEVARLISRPVRVVDELVRIGIFGVRTIDGKKLIRFADVVEFCEREDPEPIHYPK
ncbi:MAG TPA: hypothetical protein VNV41_00835 [Candidatus Acidoferrales bacterium]|jgi:hypothetical protein|nr:hypothetical protein [Candidatus Acidoferrales bacterium]